MVTTGAIATVLPNSARGGFPARARLGYLLVPAWCIRTVRPACWPADRVVRSASPSASSSGAGIVRVRAREFWPPAHRLTADEETTATYNT